MVILKRILLLLILSLSLGCSGEPKIQKVAEGEGYLLLDPEGRKLRIPVKSMEIYLVDPDYQDKYPEQFEITGPDLHLVGVFPMSVRVGYGEHFDQMLDRTIDISSSGNPSRREDVTSYITIPGETRMPIEGGTFQVTNALEKTLHGKISLDIVGGQTLSGTFVFHATTWG